MKSAKTGIAVLGLTCALSTSALAKMPANLIVPGQHIGRIRLGADAKTLKRLGDPDTGEAAMMKQWMTWYSKPPANQPDAVPAELDVYVTLAHDGDGSEKVITEARVTSASFKLANGIAAGSSFTHIKHAYPHLKLVQTYTTKKSNGPIRIYDDTQRGVAFEIYRGRDGKSAAGQCSAIIVHSPGKVAGANYLTLSDYLQGQSDPRNHTRLHFLPE